MDRVSSPVLDFLSPKDAAAVFAERWRADAVARQIWRIANNRAGWRTLGTRPPSFNGRGSDTARSAPGAAGGMAAHGLGAYEGAKFTIIEVEPLAVLGIEKQHLRLWGRDFNEVMAEISNRQRDDLAEFLERRRQAAIYAVHRTRKQVLRSDTASKELAAVFTSLLSHCELVR